MASKKAKTSVKKKVVKLAVKLNKATAKSAKVSKKVTIKKLEKVTKVFSKSELYQTLATRAELSRKQVAVVFDNLNEIIASHLKKDGPEKFILPGLLKIVIKKVPAKPARDGINPFTKEPMRFAAKPASKKVKVLALKNLKNMC